MSQSLTACGIYAVMLIIIFVAVMLIIFMLDVSYSREKKRFYGTNRRKEGKKKEKKKGRKKRRKEGRKEERNS